MKAELIDVMGDDLRVVNSARVSFDKESDWVIDLVSDLAQPMNRKVLSEKDVKLLSYLAKHGHWTPFSHVMITMREEVPIFVARQRFKHMVGFTYNEVSRRYVDTPPEFFTPDYWRKAPENRKQGSGDYVDEVLNYDCNLWLAAVHEEALSCYNNMIDNGVAPEQARMVLPQSMYTSYYVTGSLAAWARAYKLRSESTAQQEIRDLAHQWGDIIGGIPELTYSWKALTNS